MKELAAGEFNKITKANMKDSYLVKFMPCRHVTSLLEGTLYCNSLDFFRGKENENAEMGDAREGDIGINYIKDPNQMVTGRLTLDGGSIFVYCMSIDYLNPGSLPSGFFDKTFSGFKDFYKDRKEPVFRLSFIPDYFIQCVLNAYKFLKQTTQIEMVHSMVYYTDNQEEGILSVKKSMKNDPAFQLFEKVQENDVNTILAAFVKGAKYKYQHEYRFVFYNLDSNLIVKEPESDSQSKNNRYAHFVLDLTKGNEGFPRECLFQRFM